MKILIIGDDTNLAEMLAFILRQAGLIVVIVYDWEKALTLWAKQLPDLVVIDANTPELDVLEIAHALRARSTVPIVVLSFRDEEGYIIQAFDIGVDEYIAKPFSPKQLVARIRAILRRAVSIPLAALPSLTVDGLTLNPDRRTVSPPQRPEVPLTNLEFRLLHCLMINRGHVLDTETIIKKVWGYSGEGDRALLKGLVSRLRQKIEPDPKNPYYIKTVPGVGYAFSPTSDIT